MFLVIEAPFFINIEKHHMAPIKILIIEDSEAYITLLKREIFNIFGDSIDIYIAKSIKEAVKLFVSHAFELVILDLMLPDSKGYESIKRIQEVDDRVGIIICSALEDTKMRLITLISGIEIYVDKNKNDHNWGHIILSAIDSKRKMDAKATNLDKRIESLTSIIEFLSNQIKEINIAVFGNCTEESKKASLMNQIIETKNELKSTNDVTEIIKMVFWITVPIVVAIFAAATVYALFGFKAS